MPKFKVVVIYQVLAKDADDAIEVLAKHTTDLIAMKSDEIRCRLGHERVCIELDVQVDEIA